MNATKLLSGSNLVCGGRAQETVPRAGGKAPVGASGRRVLLAAIEDTLAFCPKSEKLVQHRLQQAWVLVRNQVDVDDAAAERLQSRLFPEG